MALGPDAERAALGLLERMAAAWRRGDAASYAACFTENAVQVTQWGSTVVGRRDIEAMHAAAFRTSHRRSTLENQAIERAVLLEPSGAAPRQLLATVTREVVRAAGDEDAEKRNLYRISLCCVEEGGDFIISSMHATRVIAPTWQKTGGGGALGEAHGGGRACSGTRHGSGARYGATIAAVAKAVVVVAGVTTLATSALVDYRTFTRFGVALTLAAQLLVLLRD